MLPEGLCETDLREVELDAARQASLYLQSPRPLKCPRAERTIAIAASRVAPSSRNDRFLKTRTTAPAATGGQSSGTPSTTRRVQQPAGTVCGSGHRWESWALAYGTFLPVAMRSGLLVRTWRARQPGASYRFQSGVPGAGRFELGEPQLPGRVHLSPPDDVVHGALGHP